ncbi:rhomboid family intramembrane serine protease [Algiphilus sp.]|uniref:rhomboid family intramembrane serine protease n=1 Tax=Algiphilus sp. TaxID=1872431 RepID=UPI0025B99861|nr:rhomboid family intramembrane serine protease [Algiphilus sp.]MCK5769082.1 rhomboid family intramembrane serine protease [Algiphilus sp.]
MRSETVTYVLIAACVLVFGIQMQTPGALIREFALWPLGAGFQFWQVVSSAFLHGSVFHLAVNMFGLWMFGREVETALGSRRFLVLFAVSVLTAALAQLVATGFGDPVPTVGASGGLFGVLVAFAMLFPTRRVMLLFPPIPMPAPVFVALFAAFELFAGISGTMSGVAHFAHLGGLVGGFLLVRHWRRPRAHLR